MSDSKEMPEDPPTQCETNDDVEHEDQEGGKFVFDPSHTHFPCFFLAKVPGEVNLDL